MSNLIEKSRNYIKQLSAHTRLCEGNKLLAESTDHIEELENKAKYYESLRQENLRQQERTFRFSKHIEELEARIVQMLKMV